MLAWQMVPSSNKVNELKFGFTSLDEGWVAQNQDINYAGQFGIQGLGSDPKDWGMPVTSISGIGAFGDNSSTPQTRYSWKYQILDSFTLTRGSHTLKSGADMLPSMVVLVEGSSWAPAMVAPPSPMSPTTARAAAVRAAVRFMS